MAEQKYGYPQELLTIGDHIRKKRMDLGLLQREVAAKIGVAESTVWNWEHGVNPDQRYSSIIRTFLEGSV